MPLTVSSDTRPSASSSPLPLRSRRSSSNLHVGQRVHVRVAAGRSGGRTRGGGPAAAPRQARRPPWLRVLSNSSLDRRADAAHAARRPPTGRSSARRCWRRPSRTPSPRSESTRGEERPTRAPSRASSSSPCSSRAWASAGAQAEPRPAARSAPGSTRTPTGWRAGHRCPPSGVRLAGREPSPRRRDLVHRRDGGEGTGRSRDSPCTSAR